MPAILYTVHVRDIADRQHQINEKCAANPPTQLFHQYPGGAIPLPVIDLDIRLPVYRMENYRTKIRQLAFIKQNGLADSFFANGQEDEEAQRAQHAILVGFAESGKGESIIPIKTALSKDAEQTEPLLLTRDGVIVNGNRRLAAMRELFTENSTQFARFCSVRAMILPAGITADELRRIEVRLQMTPQTLLPYEWVAEALAVRDLKERQMGNEEIASLMRLEQPSDVQVMLDRLVEAEIYLADYLHTPDAYDEVADQQQQFAELQKAIKKKTGEAKELSRRIAHVITRNSRNLGNRAYQFKMAYGNKTEEVLDQLAEQLGVDVSSNGDDTADDDSDDVFGGGAAGDPAARFTPLKEVLSDIERSEELSERIGEICEDIKETEAEKNVGRAALRNAIKANTAIAEIDLTTADPATHAAIKSQLESAVTRANTLLNQLNG